MRLLNLQNDTIQGLPDQLLFHLRKLLLLRLFICLLLRRGLSLMLMRDEPIQSAPENVVLALYPHEFFCCLCKVRASNELI